MKKLTLIMASILMIPAAGFTQEPVAVEGVSVDPAKLTVAGASSGAAMAHQLHLAYPDLFSGAALLAGGPFGCADGSLATALARCMANAESDLPVDQFVEQLRVAQDFGQVGDLDLLSDDKVWVFHGALDTVVAAELSEAIVQLYSAFMPIGQIMYIDDIEAAHTFPTLTSGNPCDAVASPFVGACNYDAAGELLKYLYGELKAPVTDVNTELTEVTLPGGSQAGLLDTAFLFVPAACKSDGANCKAQLVIHGCNQSSSQIGTGFIIESGYLEWAEANDIVLAFPQVAVEAANPYACWDWWGYSGENYRWRDGKQMKVLADWMRSLQDA